ncbi:GNAT family N-acetyltransferase [Glycomyces terrestris]|uniref:GNAT family N-acetyltransferase n=1 Tax=Glycomyces terrestris TaxID=2493553 RepID=A0A426UY30_9ACTN|nr:GNAT family N-acetyltransferase [Glycomyces terrestris]RRR99473.1 GNAT family N-acetyltransferase [Glycomyces terrestris]
MGFTTVERTSPDGLFRAVYRELLVPSFPPEELDAEDVLAAALEDGSANLFAVVDEAGAPVAAAFGEWSAESRVQLLTYLAVGPAARGGGIGGRLLREAVGAWAARRDPCLVVAEIEDPDAPADEAHGDPRRRLAFYEAAGAEVLDVPYFQPGIGGPERRVHGMLLLVLHAAPELRLGERVDGEALRLFMEDYLEEVEGGVGADAETAALFAALDRPGGVPMGPWHPGK